MIKDFVYQVRTRYGETDQMGVIYYGSYALYLEVARMEWFRSLGLPYSEMEKKGVMLPVVSFSINYKKSAYYDQILSVKVILKQEPTSKVVLDYEIYNPDNELISTANTVIVFVDKNTGKAIKAPEFVMKAIYE